MKKTSRDVILGTAAKDLAWRLYAEAGYGRVHAPVNVDRFTRELLSAARMWRTAHRNLNTQRRKTNGNTEV